MAYAPTETDFKRILQEAFKTASTFNAARFKGEARV